MNTQESTLQVQPKHKSVLQKIRRIRGLERRGNDLLAQSEEAPGRTSDSANDDTFHRASTTLGPDPAAGSASKSENHVSRVLPELHASVRLPGEAASGQSQPGNGEQRDGTTVSEQRQKRRRKRTFWELFAGFCGLSIAINSACNVNI